MTDYQRIARAIDYITEHSGRQPELEEIAASIPLSPYHFHRLFTRWAGVTPKAFLQHISHAQARKILDRNGTVFEAAEGAGLSGTGRLHDLFIKLEGMTPGEYKNGGSTLSIRYHRCGSPFGEMFIAATGRGICLLHFGVTRSEGEQELREQWPNAEIAEGRNPHIEAVVCTLSDGRRSPEALKLHLRGTPFQIQVWEALLKIPAGHLAAYSDIARVVGRPQASRAVGTAVARNPVACLIPCHRVIRKAGGFGEYRWGRTRKTAMIGWEAAQNGEG